MSSTSKPRAAKLTLLIAIVAVAAVLVGVGSASAVISVASTNSTLTVTAGTTPFTGGQVTISSGIGELTAGGTIVLSLPAGVTFAGAAAAGMLSATTYDISSGTTGVSGNQTGSTTGFNANSILVTAASAGASTLTLTIISTAAPSGATSQAVTIPIILNVSSTAALGNITVTVSGSGGASGTAVVGAVVTRGFIVSVPSPTTVTFGSGVTETLGTIRISETVTGSFINALTSGGVAGSAGLGNTPGIIITLPTGVTFAQPLTATNVQGFTAGGINPVDASTTSGSTAGDGRLDAREGFGLSSSRISLHGTPTTAGTPGIFNVRLTAIVAGTVAAGDIVVSFSITNISGATITSTVTVATVVAPGTTVSIISPTTGLAVTAPNQVRGTVSNTPGVNLRIAETVAHTLLVNRPGIRLSLQGGVTWKQGPTRAVAGPSTFAAVTNGSPVNSSDLDVHVNVIDLTGLSTTASITLGSSTATGAISVVVTSGFSGPVQVRISGVSTNATRVTTETITILNVITPGTTVEARSADGTTATIPTIPRGQNNQSLGRIRITETTATSCAATAGSNFFSVALPTGLTLSALPTVPSQSGWNIAAAWARVDGTGTVGTSSVTFFLATTGASITTAGTADFALVVNAPQSLATGDLVVTITSNNPCVTNQTLTVATVVDGSSVTVSARLPVLAGTTDQAIGNLIVTENIAAGIANNATVSFRFPEGVALLQAQVASGDSLEAGVGTGTVCSGTGFTAQQFPSNVLNIVWCTARTTITDTVTIQNIRVSLSSAVPDGDLSVIVTGSSPTFVIPAFVGTVQALSVTPTVATVQTSGTVTITITGGISPYTCTVATGGAGGTTAVVGGTCTYTAPATAGSDTVTVSDSQTPAATGTVAITITAPAPARVTVSPTSLSLDFGEGAENTSGTFTITVVTATTPPTAIAGGAVTFESGDETVATVSPGSGTTDANGQATATVTSAGLGATNVFVTFSSTTGDVTRAVRVDVTQAGIVATRSVIPLVSRTAVFETFINFQNPNDEQITATLTLWSTAGNIVTLRSGQGTQTLPGNGNILTGISSLLPEGDTAFTSGWLEIEFSPQPANGLALLLQLATFAMTAIPAIDAPEASTEANLTEFRARSNFSGQGIVTNQGRDAASITITVFARAGTDGTAATGTFSVGGTEQTGSALSNISLGGRQQLEFITDDVSAEGTNSGSIRITSTTPVFAGLLFTIPNAEGVPLTMVFFPGQ